MITPPPRCRRINIGRKTRAAFGLIHDARVHQSAFLDAISRRATFCNALIKQRFGLSTDALQVLLELSQIFARESREYFLHRLNVPSEDWRNDGFSAAC